MDKVTESLSAEFSKEHGIMLWAWVPDGITRPN